MQRPYRQCERQLKLNHSVLIAHIQKGGGDYVEVRRHRGHQGAARPGRERYDSYHLGAYSKRLDDQWRQNTGCYHRKGANELPITIVNKAIPRQFASTSKKRLSAGIM